MSIVQGQTTSFKYQLYQGLHNFSANTFNIALFTGAASINQNTVVYTPTGEVVGAGYTAGGQALTGVTISQDLAKSIAYVNFNNAVWTSASFTARCALIYNVSQGNSAVAVIDFGADKTCRNTFTVAMPGNASTTALIRSA